MNFKPIMVEAKQKLNIMATEEDKYKDEVWRVIKKYEGRYEVSDMGRIRTPSFIGWRKRFIKSIIKKSYVDVYGYEYVPISNKGKRKGPKVHRLVAIEFLPNPYNLPQINHKNGIKTDNRVINLEWITPHDNLIHAFRTGLHNGIGETHVCNVLKEREVIEIYKLMHNSPFSRSEVAKMYHVSQGCVSNIKYNKTWKWLNKL